MSAARDEVLGRIRRALRDVPHSERPDDVPVPREYVRGSDEPREALVERFAERVGEYRAVVRRVRVEDLAREIAASCERRGARTLVVPADLPEDWAPEGVELVRDGGLSNDEIGSADGVFTGCALAIAQTGTIALDGGPRQGRRAITLLPDYHLCVVFEEQIVGTVPEAIARLEGAAREGRPITLISGPSATSDIELSRVEGVHGPRNLEVLIVGQLGRRDASRLHHRRGDDLHDEPDDYRDRQRHREPEESP